MALPTHLRMRPLVPLGLVVGGLIFLMSAAPAFALPDVTLSLTNAPSYCVNRQGGNNSHGANVILYACSGGNNHWYEAPAYYINQAPPDCAANNCIVFEDYWNTDSCFGISAGETGTLGSCTNLLQFWIAQPGNILRNAYWHQDLITNNAANGATLSINPTPVLWHQWSGE